MIENLKNFRKQLPIFKERSTILECIRDNPVTIVIGETGSGKTTQVPQYLYESGYGKKGIIACTQPRRVAALSLAKRVADEVVTKLGDIVGYTIRFEDKTTASTKIKYMTDGMLLRELLNDQLLMRYSVIVLDEAHERTIRTDILFGMIKIIMEKRPTLKVIVMSATLEAEKFSRYFNNAKILIIPGRMHPVKLLCSVEPQTDYLDSTLVSIFQIHIEQPSGDILVFLTGQEEIESIEKLLLEHACHCPPNCPKLLIRPLFANLPTHQQSSVFTKTPPGCRKVILATNIAETSITISGIRYVIDSGLHKVRGYDSRTGMETLSVQPISKASARQRAGRAGREAPGVCYRLYTEDTFNSLLDSDIPEIQRCHLSSIILLLKASNVPNVLKFDFMARPSKDALVKALEELYALEAIDDKQELSEIGIEMSKFPLDPPYAKVLIKAKEFGCLQEVISVISLLSVETIFYTPHDKRDEVVETRRKFTSYDGDLITFFNVLESYLAVGKDKKWCTDHFINHRSLQHVLEVRKQLQECCERMKYENAEIDQKYSLHERLLQAFLTGFFTNLAMKQPDGSYKSLFNSQMVHIHPSSTLFGQKPDLVMYCDIVWTSKRYMRSVSRVDISWLSLASNRYFNDQVVGR